MRIELYCDFLPPIILVLTVVFVREIIADGENERRRHQFKPRQRMRLLDDRTIIKFVEHGRRRRRQLLVTAEVTEVVTAGAERRHRHRRRTAAAVFARRRTVP